MADMVEVRLDDGAFVLMSRQAWLELLAAQQDDDD